MSQQKIKFNKKKHTYKINNIELTPVTAWIKTFFNPFDEKVVAKKLKYIYKSKGIKKGIREILKEWKQKRNDGTIVHKELDHYVKYLLESDDKHGIKNFGFNKKTFAGIKFLNDYLKITNCCLSEFIVYNEQLKLAGTIDLIISDGINLTLVDWKTNDSLKFSGYAKSKHALTKDLEDCNFIHYSIQLNVYAYLLECLGFSISKLLIVHLKDNEYNKYEVNYNKRLVEDMLRWDKRIP